MPTATYHVSLAAFTGPFDLLLHLISRRTVDVYDIPIAAITDDYLAVLAQVETVELEPATEFLVVAATLLELKAARLLPDDVDEDLDELALEARDLLYARLLEYRTFKQGAVWVRAQLDAHAGHVPRRVALEERFARVRPDVTLPLDAAELAALAARVLAEQPARVVDLGHLQPLRMTVREAAGMVLDELERAGGAVTFRELTAGCRHRVEVIVHFLALLELFKLDVVDLEQHGTGGEVHVALLADGDTAPEWALAQVGT